MAAELCAWWLAPDHAWVGVLRTAPGCTMWRNRFACDGLCMQPGSQQESVHEIIARPCERRGPARTLSSLTPHTTDLSLLSLSRGAPPLSTRVSIPQTDAGSTWPTPLRITPSLQSTLGEAYVPATDATSTACWGCRPSTPIHCAQMRIGSGAARRAPRASTRSKCSGAPSLRPMDGRGSASPSSLFAQSRARLANTRRARAFPSPRPSWTEEAAGLGPSFEHVTVHQELSLSRAMACIAQLRTAPGPDTRSAREPRILSTRAPFPLLEPHWTQRLRLHAAEEFMFDPPRSRSVQDAHCFEAFKFLSAVPDRMPPANSPNTACRNTVVFATNVTKSALVGAGHT